MTTRTKTALPFDTVAAMAAAEGGYISSGYPELAELSSALINNLVGTASIGGQEVHCLPYGTQGRSAVTGVLLPFASNGRKVVAAGNVFGGTWAFLKFVAPVYGGQAIFADFNDLEGLTKTLQEHADAAAVFFEPISNPLLRVVDVTGVVELTRAFCPKAMIIADDTLTAGLKTREGKLATRWLLEQGVDIAIAALTKYVCGYNDERGGSVIMLERELLPWMDIPLPFIGKQYQMFEFIRKIMGLPHPSATELLLERVGGVQRRLRRHSESAFQFADGLGHNIAVYPGLPDHPDCACVERMDLANHGGIVSFQTGGGFEQAGAVADNMATKGLGVISNSFGSKQTFIEPVMAAVGEKLRPILRSVGIPDDLVRVSLGHGAEPGRAYQAGVSTSLLLDH